MTRKSPYTVPTSETKLVRIHKNMVGVLNKECKKHQRIADAKFGKNKYKVRPAFASKVLGGFLK